MIGLRFRTLLFLLVMVSSPIAAGDAVLGADLKAAYIFNFAKFVEWPDQSGKDSIQFCLFGRDDLENAIKKYQDRSVQGKTLEFLKVRTNDDLLGCEILFVSETESLKVDKIISATKGLSILTISVVDGFAEAGGIINLMWVKNKLRFDVNKGVADNENIIISARLLKLANRVLVDSIGKRK